MHNAFGRPVGIAHLTTAAAGGEEEGKAESQKNDAENGIPSAAQDNRCEHCTDCGAELSRDDIGLTKKLVNRGAVTFFCKACLARKFDMTVDDCDTLIAHFREAGCHFFQ